MPKYTSIINTKENKIRDSWETPQDLFDVLDGEFGFYIDVCASRSNSKCNQFIDECTDAFMSSGDWFDPHERMVAWCNPPYSNPLKPVARSIIEVNDKPGSVVVMLLNHDASTKWYKLALENASEIRIMTGKRVQFVAPDGIKASSNSKAQCVIVFRKKQHSAPCHVWHWDWTADIDQMKKENDNE